MMVDLVIPGYYKIAFSRKNIMYAFNPKILYSEYLENETGTRSKCTWEFFSVEKMTLPLTLVLQYICIF